MAYDEETYEKLAGNFQLLCNIIRQKSEGEQLKVDLSRIEEMIQKKIPDTLKENAPEDFYELYINFKSEYEKFRDFILYDKLIGKNIIALGGGFSSGKSSFLNALMGKRVLPADIDPSTSVPTYIVSGEKHEVLGINVFDAKVQMQPKDIRKIAHGFGELEDEEEEKVADAVTLGHVLENIFFSTPLHKYDRIAFLDTPGYSKPDSEKYSAKTDEQIARGQLNASNYILWFVQADAGTITEEDIKFIKTLREDTPKLVIVNKADKKNLKDLKEIISKIKASLDIKGVRYVDVFAFTSRINQVENEELCSFIEADTEKIKKQIESWNRQVYESNFARNFKILFVRCREFYEDEIDEESRKLVRLNTSITKLSIEDVDSEILEPLQSMVRDAQKTVNELKDIREKLKELQDDFFTEIKFISDVVGIAMPEPSEIDLLQDNVQNPMELIAEYKKEKNIQTDPSIGDMLQGVFEGIEPVINKRPGGSEYRDELLDIILAACNVETEEIHIYDCVKNTEEYAELCKLEHESVKIGNIFGRTEEYAGIVKLQ
ncbi:GTPase Era [Lachnospiraceae bacterium]|nr:GTPase Era [Lachnospiraceae bacterium]